ncbi:MAG: hypothetical protein R3C59_04390 [Planctomycetaceae bacterium]
MPTLDDADDSRRPPIRQGNPAATPPTYPKRPPFFANRLIRLLQKSCAANEIGVEACWLVTCVALVEDAKRYSGPVTFWTGQLLPITGFQSWGRLDRARQRAVEAGWLHYIAGTNRQSARYWTLVPASVAAAFDDSPVDELNHHNSDSLDINHQNRAHDGERNVVETESTRDRSEDLSWPGPIPKPKPHGNHGECIPGREQVWRDLKDADVRTLARSPDEARLRELYRVGVTRWGWPDDGAMMHRLLAMVRHCGTAATIEHPAAVLKASLRDRAYGRLSDADEDWARSVMTAWRRPTAAPVVAVDLTADRSGDEPSRSRAAQMSALAAMARTADSRAGP